MCVNLKNSTTKKFAFSLQWHLTAQCDQKCKHCYMFDSPTYPSECQNELSFEACKTILDDFSYSLKKLNTEGALFFTGGDPILREDFFDILSYARSKGQFTTGVMGNPYHIDKKTAIKLRDHGVMFYQISLDGLRETHDSFRKPGSFDATIECYKTLKEAGITPLSMFTVSKVNMHELIDVIRLVTEIGVGGFSFDRLVPVGCGENLKEQLMSAPEYKELLTQVHAEFNRLKKAGSKTAYAYKDTLWGLLLSPEEERETLEGMCPPGYELSRGCCIGDSAMAILADGNVMACRRLPILIGKVPEQTLLDIFENSPKLAELKNMKAVESCGKCEKFENCRGCRAVAYGHSGGNYNAPDPQCWHEV